ncbi:MAG: efflux RND transporter periplasmic adaptor subunit [Armatimonadota bacterium]|nr:efflux RND transporter periplasmic adaptor subunit [Armatimonadota bacterium]
MRIKRRRRLLYIVIIPLILAAVLIIVLSRRNHEETIIQTASVERGTVTATVSANGVLQPLTTVEIKSNVGGQIVKLAVDEGDSVKAGQLIARIDPTDSLTTFQQSRADLAAAISKVDQAHQQLAMQHEQNTAQVESARQGLDAARAKLMQAQEQARAQPELTRASIGQAKSGLAAAEAALRQVRTATVPQKIAAAQSGFDQARASADVARKELARQRELLAKGFVARSQVDVAEEKYDVAKAQLESATRKLDTVKDETDQDIGSAEARVGQAKAELANATANSVQVKIRQQELASARAALKQADAAVRTALAATRQDRIRRGDIVQAGSQVKRAEAALRNSTTQLGYTTITAPRAGIVTKKYVEEGSIVTAGRSSFSGTGSGVAIVDIADISRMFALVNVDETDVAQIEVGQEVDITVEAYPDELFTGKVTKIAPQAQVDQNVTTVPVTVEVDIPDERLKPGMNVTCDFVTGRADDVLMVPNEAIRESDEGNTVTALNHGKQVTRRVETGLVGQDNTEIKSGLRRGEKVVTAVIEPNAEQRQSGGFGAGGGRGGPGPGGFGGMRRF